MSEQDLVNVVRSAPTAPWTFFFGAVAAIIMTPVCNRKIYKRINISSQCTFYREYQVEIQVFNRRVTIKTKVLCMSKTSF